jgi:hypothetical protein
MRKYLICYWVERNDVATDLEDVVEADNIREALDEFITTTVFRKINSISEIIDVNYTPNFK